MTSSSAPSSAHSSAHSAQQAAARVRDAVHAATTGLIEREQLAELIVLAAVAQAFAEHDVSIQTVRQEGRGDDAQLVVVSHRASDADLAATVETLRGMAFVRAVSSVMRVEGEGE